MSHPHADAPSEDTPSDYTAFEDTAFDLHASVSVNAPAHSVYSLISDLTRMGEWSPENIGGDWISGTPGAAGSRFRGHNRTAERAWSTECEIVAAEPPRLFAWTVLSSVDEADSSRWSFEIDPDRIGCALTQRYVMSKLRYGLRVQLAELSADQAGAFLARRRATLESDMRRTVWAIKHAAEAACADVAIS